MYSFQQDLWYCQPMLLFFAISCVQNTIPILYETDHSSNNSGQVDLLSIEIAINESLLTVLDYNATTISESYNSIMSYSDSSCPAAYEQDGNSFWYGQCKSEQEMTYDGYLFYTSYQNHDLFGDGTIWDATSFAGSSNMQYPTGENAHWGGNSYIANGTNPEGMPTFLSIINGSFWDQNADSWLKDGLSTSMVMYAIDYILPEFPDATANFIHLNGSLPITNGEITAISFQEVSLYSETLQYPCELEPIGRLSARTVDSDWIEIHFDVEEDWTLTGLCDGCGSAYLNDQLVGEICLDLSPILDWEEAPWSSY